MKNCYFIITILLICVGFPFFALAQSRVLTFGNLADADAAFFQQLEQELAIDEMQTSVVISGDLIDGCVTDQASFDHKALDQFIAIVQKYPKIPFYVVPGDRDWNYSKADGWACVQALDDYLERQNLSNLHWELDKGCPGPKVIELSTSTILIMINTQWWNHPFEKPTPADALCKYSEPEIILEEIHDAIEENLNKNVLIAGHFPPQSQSRFGGVFPLTDHVKPPLIGTIKVAYRQSVGKATDIQNAIFDPFRRVLIGLTTEYKGLLFLSGHDPNHQVLNLQTNYLINSGSPSKGKWVAKHKPALFASNKAGLGHLIFHADGKVDYQFLPQQKENLVEEYTLYSPPCKDNVETNLIPNPTFSSLSGWTCT